MNKFRDMRHYFNNRWISKSHALTSNLKRGQWHEFDTRLLHALFDELVNFVEVEEAWMHVICDDEYSKKYKKPWFRFGEWRCPEAGLAYLDWASFLKHDQEWDKNEPYYGLPTSQAIAAQETKALYTWWKEDRPKRPDPMDASGWSDYCDEKEKEANARGKKMWIGCDKDAADQERASKIHEILSQMEQEQDDEDTAMLIRLIKVRHSLWT